MFWEIFLPWPGGLHLDTLLETALYSHFGTPTKDKEGIEPLQRTLDLLILRTLLPGPAHGHAITVETPKSEKLAIAQILPPAEQE